VKALEYLKAFLTECEAIHNEWVEGNMSEDECALRFVSAYSLYKDDLCARTLAIVQDGTCHDERG